MLQLDALERQVATAQLMAGFARAQGADAEIPDLAAERAAWEVWLCSPPEDADGGDPQRAAVMRALGLRT